MGKKKKEHIVFDQLERVRKRENIRWINSRPIKEKKNSDYNKKDWRR